MGFFFKHKISDTYTLSIDLKNNKQKYEMFCDIYARFDKNFVTALRLSDCWK